MVELDGETLDIEKIYKISKGSEVTLSASARKKVRDSRDNLDRLLRSGERIYGVNTGFGKLLDVDISSEELEELQKNLVRSHSSGIGDPLSKEHVRAIIAVRINSLTKGYSGIRETVLDSSMEVLNKDLYPFVPSLGSVGASGDLAPLAHIALALMGEGEMIHGGKRIKASDQLQKNGIKKVTLREKEGVAFINGTSAITGILSYELFRAFDLIRGAICSSALSFVAMKGNPDAFQPWISEVRRHKGQGKVSSALVSLIEGSSNIRARLQDAYSLRCTPQVFGAVYDTLSYARSVAETEMNSVTDNPLIHGDEVISAGNFHGEPVALVSDFVSIALTDLGNMIERRIARIVDPALSGLPPFLTKHEGLNSGYMIPQYTAAALCNMNKSLCYPSSADSIPTCANQEDHVSMGMNSALKLSKIVDNLSSIVSIEFLLGSQAVELSDAIPSEKILKLKEEVRKIVRPLDTDRPPYVDIESIQRSLLEGDLGRLCHNLISKII
ncbi:MAG: histidine ammonia-lyase [Candidatus Thermoplasmatota archaeon]|nr:histidine ammonia-lyase [Candidatus Thermoplasmatota archaeon]MCL5665508.1 histidine ammonia-lyase [Candidatus Thermoplasmatota archaeon]